MLWRARIFVFVFSISLSWYHSVTIVCVGYVFITIILWRFIHALDSRQLCASEWDRETRRKLSIHACNMPMYAFQSAPIWEYKLTFHGHSHQRERNRMRYIDENVWRKKKGGTKMLTHFLLLTRAMIFWLTASQHLNHQQSIYILIQQNHNICLFPITSSSFVHCVPISFHSNFSSVALTLATFSDR